MFSVCGLVRTKCEILGYRTEQPENRGVEDIFIACTDNLTGFSAAIEAIYPKTEIQNCIIHQLRNSSKYVSYKDLKALIADLKAVYAAVDEPAALDALDTFAEHWDKNTPKFLSRGGITGQISVPISSFLSTSAADLYDQHD